MLSTGDGEADGENVELIAAGEGGSGGDGSGEGPRGAQRMTTPYMTKVKFFCQFRTSCGEALGAKFKFLSPPYLKHSTSVRGC